MKTTTFSLVLACLFLLSGCIKSTTEEAMAGNKDKKTQKQQKLAKKNSAEVNDKKPAQPE